MSEFIIETKHLTKQYGAQKSVADLNIHVRKGRIYGLLGRNGAGKTTAMKLLLGLTEPTAGEVLLWGTPLRGVPNAHAMQDALELVGLPYKDNKLFSQYSLGMKQRLAIALAVMHDPELLILD